MIRHAKLIVNMDGRYYQVKDFSPTGAARTISIDLGALYRWDKSSFARIVKCP